MFFYKDGQKLLACMDFSIPELDFDLRFISLNLKFYLTFNSFNSFNMLFVVHIITTFCHNAGFR